ncbi:MAG: TIGR00153 family protein [bacterium]
MRTIAKLFGHSPFAPLQMHMNKVTDCVEKVSEIFSALDKGEQENIEALARELSTLEHTADLAKNDIRNNLPKGLFLAVNRANILEILALQDSIADKSEDIGVLLTYRKLGIADEMKEHFNAFLEKNLDTFHAAERIIQQMDELLQTSFGGKEAEKVKKMVDEVAFKEHEADLLQQELLKKLFSIENKLSYSSFILWLRTIETLGAISNLAEKLGNRVRMTLELK